MQPLEFLDFPQTLKDEEVVSERTQAPSLSWRIAVKDPRGVTEETMSPSSCGDFVQKMPVEVEFLLFCDLSPQVCAGCLGMLLVFRPVPDRRAVIVTHPQMVGRGTCTEKIRLKSAWCNRCERVREQRGKCAA